MRRSSTLLLWLAFSTAALGLLGSYGGALHALGDSLAVFRLQLGLGTGGAALALGLSGHRLLFAPAVLALAAVAGVVGDTRMGAAAVGRGFITHYQKNLSFRLADSTAVIADIRAAAPDIVTLQELTSGNMAVLGALAADLPTQLHCRFARVGAVAVASRWPLVAGSETCLERSGLVALQVHGPRGPLWLVSLHLHWPWPHRQPDQLARILPTLAAFDGPIVVGGDFNMVPWSHTLRQIARATGSIRARPARSSFPRYHPLVGLPIDHVLSPGGGAATLRPLLGSDHHGLLVQIPDWTASMP